MNNTDIISSMSNKIEKTKHVIKCLVFRLLPKKFYIRIFLWIEYVFLLFQVRNCDLIKLR